MGVILVVGLAWWAWWDEAVLAWRYRRDLHKIRRLHRPADLDPV